MELQETYIPSATPRKNLTTMNLAKVLHSTVRNRMTAQIILKPSQRVSLLTDWGFLVHTWQWQDIGPVKTVAVAKQRTVA